MTMLTTTQTNSVLNGDVEIGASTSSESTIEKRPLSPGGQPKLAPLACGIVLFDHVDDVSNGTAYLPGMPVQRIRSPNDLRNDVLWISNLSVFEEKVRHHPTLRSGFYFRIGLTEIAQDMGIQTSRDGQMDPEDALKLATLMTRTMTIAARAYGWDVSELGPLRVQEPFLMKDIHKMLSAAPVPDARFREDLTRALTQAHQAASEPDWPALTYEPDSVFVTLRFNRLGYVQQMLEAPLPAGRGWVKVEGMKSGTNVMDYCLGHATLVKATVEWDNASSDIAALAAYGQAGRKRNPMRLWLAQPELVWLSRHARVTITSIWADQSGYIRLAPGARLPGLFVSHPEACLSYSAGLVAFSHWDALSSCHWNRRSRAEESNVWATWLRAMDRAMMFSVALKAHEAGFHVERYGAGALKVRCTRDRLVELVQFKHENGFMYPDISSLLQRHELV